MWSADVYFLAALLGLDRDELFRLPVRWPPPSIASAPAAAVSRSCEAILQYFSIDKNGFKKKGARWHSTASQTNLVRFMVLAFLTRPGKTHECYMTLTMTSSYIRELQNKSKLNVLPHTRRLRNLFWPRRVIWLYSRWASFHPLCPLIRKQMKEPLL